MFSIRFVQTRTEVGHLNLMSQRMFSKASRNAHTPVSKGFKTKTLVLKPPETATG